MSSFTAFDSFQGDLDGCEYIEKICLSLKSDNDLKTDFECVPYIEAFESQLQELKKFYLAIETRVEKLSFFLDSEQGDVHQKMISLSSAFEAAFESFSYVNQSADKISATALRIGKQIESIQNEKNRSEEAKEILGYFLELNSASKCAKIDNLVVINSYDAKMKLADLLRKLYHIAKANISGAENASEIISKKYSAFENQSLSDFMEAFTAEDISGMKDASNVLVTLNDASSCIKIFIEKHAFFQEPYNCDEIRKLFFTSPNDARIPILYSQSHPIDPGLLSAFELILKTVAADWVYLEEVFENPRNVMDTLIGKVFEEIIMRHIDEGLKFAGLHSTAQYLKYLKGTFGETLVFIESLLQIYREHMDDLPVSSIDGAVEETRSYLMGLHHDVFSRYLKKSDIQMLESRFLKEIIDICSITSQNFVNNKKIAKASKNLFNIQTGSDPRTFSYSDVKQRCGFYQFRDGLLVSENDFDSPIISQNTLLKVFIIVSESIDRLIKFYNEKTDVQEMIESYMTFFMEALRKSCITPAFLFIVENEDIGSTSKPFDGRNFALIQKLNSLLSIVQVYFEEHIIPTSSAISPICCRKMFDLKNSFFEACIRYMNKVLKLEINGISLQLNNIAQKYLKKSDYKPKPDDLSAFNSTTQYCSNVKEYLRICAKNINSYLSKQNSRSVINKIVKIFFEQLIELIKKIIFNDVGALVLLNDINSYAEMLSDLSPESQKELGVFFNFLRELSNVLMVKPENLRSVLQEGTLNLIDIKLFYPFIALRSDFKTSKIDTLFPEMANLSTPGINTNGLF